MWLAALATEMKADIADLELKVQADHSGCGHVDIVVNQILEARLLDANRVHS